MTDMPDNAATAAPAGVQLRILSGCHLGATLAVAPAQQLSVGSDGDCDVLLRDCGLAPGDAVLIEWEAQRWSMLAADGAAAPVGWPLGTVALLGGISITLCAGHVPWQAALALPQEGAAADTAQQAPAERGEDLLEQMLPEAAPAPAALAPAQGETRISGVADGLRRMGRGTAAVLVLGVAWVAWSLTPASAQSDPGDLAPAPVALSPQAQEQAVKAASLAIALVDPALRLRVEPRPEGGVTVSGWVDNVEQFDRLAQGLSGLRPLPRLAVRTAGEVLDSLADAGSAQGAKLQFALLGAGQVQVRGVVASAGEQQLLLAQLRARAPEGIEIIGALRVAAEQGPAVRGWLQAQGFTVTRADWDGEQLVLGVDVRGAQRGPLERLLAGSSSPLTDIPFLLQSRVLKAEAEAAAERLRIGDAGLPLRIRSVVSGAAPYVVLADGAKLQPGGQHAGWRLVAIAPDHLVLDGPKRLEINR
ncbi:type III secretion system inner membrane ring subunit SctD [Comamonas antarctica]|uniref:type III secretion system inner membrane ring subunit SctD n=1 Tax=Comamonas antarctica TaxID=2743470 RepID=UPI0028EAB547|nr:type III secretion system inner membrane ring subunit SctD [Comamonas antarctica]